MAFTQEDVNNWFTANPNATTTDVARAVQGLGGLEANQGLAGMIGQHYGTDAATVNNAYNQWANPVAPATSNTGVASNAPINFADYAPASIGMATPAAQGFTSQPQISPIQNSVNKWKADNPNGTPQQIANAIAAAGGLTPEIAQAVASAYGTNVDEINAGYGKWNPYTQMETMYGNKDYSGINSLLGSSGLTSSQVQQHFGLTDEQMNQARGLGVNLNYTTPEIQNLVTNTLGSKTLAPWEQINQIIETGQKYGFGTPELEKLYGKDKVAQSLDTYKKGISSFLTDTFANKDLSAMDKYGLTHGAATKYHLSNDDLVQYGGLTQAQAKDLSDNYTKGLGSIVSALTDPKVSNAQKAQMGMYLDKKFGATDEEIAKASNGKWKTEDVKGYMQPVRDFPSKMQELWSDPNATAKDITKALNDFKADERIGAVYGKTLDAVLANPQDLLFRDVMNGNNSYESAKDFLATAKSTPELATKYADQIKGIEQILAVTDRARNKDFGGKLPDYAMSMFLGLDKKTQSSAPKQLELTPPKTETRTGYDGESGTPYTYQVNIPAELKPGQKGVEPIISYGNEGEPNIIEGYRKKVDSGDFKNLYANYDVNGKLLGYEDRSSRVHVSDPQYYYAKFDANGVAKPGTGVNRSGGFLKNTVQDIASMGPIGQIALMAATGGLGSLAAGALANTALGAALGTIGTNAVASGLVSGALSEVGGGDFGKGFAGGAVGSGIGNLAGSYMPADMTGNPMVDSYLAKALPTAAGSMAQAGVMGGDVGNAGIYSLLNTGVNMGVNAGTNELLKDTGMDKLGAMQPYATGIASNLVTSLLTNKDPNVKNAIMNTMMQQAMQTGKQAVKTAGKP